MPPVSDDRDLTLNTLHGVHDGRQLGESDARHDPSRADRTGSHTDLDRIRSSLHESRGSLLRADVSSNDLCLGEPLPSTSHRLEHALGVAMGRIHHEYIHAGVDDRLGPVERVLRGSDRPPHPQPPMLILTRSGKEPAFEDVLDGNQSLQRPVFVDNRQFFDPVLMKDPFGGLERRPLRNRNQAIGGHHLADRTIQTTLEL